MDLSPSVLSSSLVKKDCLFQFQSCFVFCAEQSTFDYFFLSFYQLDGLLFWLLLLFFPIEEDLYKLVYQVRKERMKSPLCLNKVRRFI